MPRKRKFLTYDKEAAITNPLKTRAFAVRGLGERIAIRNVGLIFFLDYELLTLPGIGCIKRAVPTWTSSCYVKALSYRICSHSRLCFLESFARADHKCRERRLQPKDGADAG
jgi:hypothetical protein